MSRYIDADKLIDALEAQADDDWNQNVSMTYSKALYEVIDIIQGMNEADAVEVVRCKDCRFAQLTYDGECKYCDQWSEEFDGEREKLYLIGDFYCAFGERK